MAITFPRSIPPEMVFQRVTMRSRSVVGLSQSPFTLQQQAQKHQGQRWEADVVLAPTDTPDNEVVAAWLTSLNGREKTFLFGDPARVSARGSASSAPGSPVVTGASNAGNSLAITGAPANKTGYLRVGDYIQLGTASTSRLHKQLEDVSTSAAGTATLNLWPDLRSTPASGAVVTVASAVGHFRLAANDSSWDETTILFGITFGIVETL